MKKILLTSGSSFSYDRVKIEDDSTDNFKKWPTILAEQLDLNLINKSKPGASNLYIYDHLMENILEYEGNIELVVAAWSYGFKTSIFRNHELNFVNITEQDWEDIELVHPATTIKDKIIESGLLASSIEQTLRLMRYLQDTCDSKNIKCIHYPLLNIFKSNLSKQSHIKLLEQIINTRSFELIQSFKNTLGWPCDTALGGYTYSTAYKDHIISQKNQHPNDKGQKIIATEIYDKYLQIQGYSND